MAASTHTEMAGASAQEKLEKMVSSMMTTQSARLGLRLCDTTISQKKAALLLAQSVFIFLILWKNSFVWREKVMIFWV